MNPLFVLARIKHEVDFSFDITWFGVR